LTFGLLMLSVICLGVWQGVLVRRGAPQAMKMALRQEQVVTPSPASLGTIYVRAGRDGGKYIPLAVSEQAPSVYADPGMIKDFDLGEASVRIGQAIGASPVDIENIIVSHRYRSENEETGEHGAAKHFAWLKRGITPQQADVVRALKIPGVGVSYEWNRQYPNHDLAAQVLGFRTLDGLPGGGVELSQNYNLIGIDGVKEALADARRRQIYPLAGSSQAPVDGKRVYLTLDANIQQWLQEAVSESVEKFHAHWGAGVVVNVNTGEILGLCSAPTYDPNDFNHYPPDAVKLRAITDPYEPGSAAKPIFAAAAVDRGVVGWQTMIDCMGGNYIAAGGGRISDHGAHYGVQSVIDIIVNSSNVGMAKIGEKLGLKAEHDIAVSFGLGHITDIGLPGESCGILRDLKKMDGYSLRRITFGQEVGTTSIQLAMAFAALSNGGLLLKPRLIDHVSDATGILQQSKTEVVRRVIRPQTSAQAVSVMQEVVERGTGKLCKSDLYNMAGKTGTAQIPGQGGYIDGAFTGSFIGIAPASHPMLVCLVSVYWPDRSKGHFGATVAAPYVKTVLEKSLTYMNVPPDKPPKTDTAVAASDGEDRHD
jgi:cell division protein FtsI/penicillin-binding protein 2